MRAKRVTPCQRWEHPDRPVGGWTGILHQVPTLATSYKRLQSFVQNTILNRVRVSKGFTIRIRDSKRTLSGQDVGTQVELKLEHSYEYLHEQGEREWFRLL